MVHFPGIVWTQAGNHGNPTVSRRSIPKRTVCVFLFFKVFLLMVLRKPTRSRSTPPTSSERTFGTTDRKPNVGRGDHRSDITTEPGNNGTEGQTESNGIIGATTTIDNRDGKTHRNETIAISVPLPSPLRRCPPPLAPRGKASVTSDADVLAAINVESYPDGQAVSHEAVFGNSLTYDATGTSVVSASVFMQVRG